MHMADISYSSPSVKHSSMSNINNFSDDVMREIFIRLPFRSTVKCKCVCKRWLRLISSPYFPTKFVSRQYSLFKAYFTFLSPHQLMLGFFPSDLDFNAQIHKVPLSPTILIKGDICGYSNGLFLCCSNRYTRGWGYFVYDPFTKECNHIPPFPDLDKKECIYAVGFLSQINDFEEEENSNRCFWVVVVRSFLSMKYEFEVEVFYSGTRTWRQILMSCVDGFAFAPHWFLGFAFEGYLYFMGSMSILVLDPILMICNTIDYPEKADAMNIMSFGYLGCSGGTMRIADIGYNDLTVWELLIPGTWDLVYRTNLNLMEHLPTRFCSNYCKRVGGFHPYDGDIVYLHSYVDGIYAINMGTNKVVPISGYDKFDISPFHLELSPIPLTDNDCK